MATYEWYNLPDRDLDPPEDTPRCRECHDLMDMADDDDQEVLDSLGRADGWVCGECYRANRDDEDDDDE